MFRILVNRAKTRGEREGRTRPVLVAHRRPGRTTNRPSTRTASCRDGRWAGFWSRATVGRAPPRGQRARCRARQRLRGGIDALPPAQRTVLELRDVQGFTPPRCASCSTVSEANQRVLLHRARSKARAAARGLLSTSGRGGLMRQPEVRCVEFVETVTDWMEGALPDDDRLAVEEHLVICPHCTEYLVQLRLTAAVLGEQPATEAPPPDARAALLDAFRRRS